MDEGEIDLKYLHENVLARKKFFMWGTGRRGSVKQPACRRRSGQADEVQDEARSAITDVRGAIKPDAPLLPKDCSPNPSPSPPGNRATSAAISRSERQPRLGVFPSRFYCGAGIHRLHGTPGLYRAACLHGWWAPDGNLRVWTSTQGAFGMRDQTCEAVKAAYVENPRDPPGSGRRLRRETADLYFSGSRGSSFIRKANRPVKMTMTRAEVFLATNPTSGAHMKVKIGATREGRITAAQAELYFEAGAFPSAGVIGYLGFAMAYMFAPYEIPHGQIDAYDVVVNKPRTAAYRAPGVPQANFPVEQLVDEMAVRLGMDPIEFRLKNVVREGSELITGTTHGNIGAEEVLKAARSSQHYRTPLSGPNRGRGVAQAYWGNWGARSSCTISVNGDGTVEPGHRFR